MEPRRARRGHRARVPGDTSIPRLGGARPSSTRIAAAGCAIASSRRSSRPTRRRSPIGAPVMRQLEKAVMLQQARPALARAPRGDGLPAPGHPPARLRAEEPEAGVQARGVRAVQHACSTASSTIRFRCCRGCRCATRRRSRNSSASARDRWRASCSCSTRRRSRRSRVTPVRSGRRQPQVRPGLAQRVAVRRGSGNGPGGHHAGRARWPQGRAQRAVSVRVGHASTSTVTGSSLAKLE